MFSAQEGSKEELAAGRHSQTLRNPTC